MIAALEMLALAPVEMRAPFLVHQPGSRIGKGAVGIAQSLDPLGIEEQRPARTQTPQRIVRPRTDRDQFGFGRGFTIGTATRSEEHTSELQSLMRISHLVSRLHKNRSSRPRRRQPPPQLT